MPIVFNTPQPSNYKRPPYRTPQTSNYKPPRPSGAPYSGGGTYRPPQYAGGAAMTPAPAGRRPGYFAGSRGNPRPPQPPQMQGSAPNWLGNAINRYMLFANAYNSIGSMRGVSFPGQPQGAAAAVQAAAYQPTPAWYTPQTSAYGPHYPAEMKPAAPTPAPANVPAPSPWAVPGVEMQYTDWTQPPVDTGAGGYGSGGYGYGDWYGGGGGGGAPSPSIPKWLYGLVTWRI